MINKKKLILFVDSGDTFIDESTEIYDNYGLVVDAKFIEGSIDFLKTIYQEGYIIVLVADGNFKSFENVYKKYDLWNIFYSKIISSEVGKQKPNAIMFEKAIESLDIKDLEKDRIVMIGNNLRKDILGANNMGLTSIWMNWSPRYFNAPRNEKEEPDYIVNSPKQLMSLIEELENKKNK